MQEAIPTTPFGRRTLTLAHVATQVLAKSRPAEKVVHKWNVFRAICLAKTRLGISERAIAVLDALLTFHPETALTGKDLIVWPSNRQLALRAHGMAPATLRRHLAALVDAGLIVRRDSPNGKRYARKGGGGEVDQAFGFDLSPIVVRGEELEALAEQVRQEERAVRLLREQITFTRRDIAKMIATGMEEGVSTQREGAGPGSWVEIHETYRSIVSRLPRQRGQADMEPVAEELVLLAEEIRNLLESHVIAEKLSANESQSERHKQNSNPNEFSETETACRLIEDGSQVVPPLTPSSRPSRPLPLSLVLQACPQIVDYAKTGIHSWADLSTTSDLVRSMLGISASAWREARDVLGPDDAATTVAAILERADSISSAGGYLRSLVAKARVGEFSLGPVLFALLRKRPELNLGTKPKMAN